MAERPVKITVADMRSAGACSACLRVPRAALREAKPSGRR
jgi:hypothetical protein